MSEQEKQVIQQAREILEAQLRDVNRRIAELTAAEPTPARRPACRRKAG